MDLDLDIVLNDNQLIELKRTRSNYEYIIWLFLLIGLPGFFILNPSTATLILSLFYYFTYLT